MRQRASEGGFTLIEVIVATGIFVLVSTAATVALVSALNTVRDNADRVIASSIARTVVEDLQAKGAESITPGRTTSTVQQGNTAFTVQVDAAWMKVDQVADPCKTTVDPTKFDFMRVTVSVIGGDLRGAQVIDAIVSPSKELVTEGGSISVQVIDAAFAPVPGVAVAVSGGGGATPSYVTGADGCVLIPSLAPSPSWVVTISKAGYVSRDLGGTAKSVQVIGGSNTPVQFLYDLASRVKFRSIDDSFVLLADMPIQLVEDRRARVPAPPYAYPVTVTDLFPGTYQAWTGTCTDAGQRQTTVSLAAGATADAKLLGNLVEVLAPPGTTVKVKHAALAGGVTCTNGGATTSYAAGVVGNSAIMRLNIPTGSWVMSGTNAAPSVLADADVALTASSPSPCRADLGLEATARDVARRVIDAANALASADKKPLSQKYLLDAARDLSVPKSAGPGANEVTLEPVFGDVTARMVVAVDANGAAAIAGNVEFLVAGKPWVLSAACPKKLP